MRIIDHYNQAKEEIGSAIKKEDESYIANLTNSDIEQLTEHLVQKHILPTIDKDTERVTSIDKKKIDDYYADIQYPILVKEGLERVVNLDPNPMKLLESKPKYIDGWLIVRTLKQKTSILSAIAGLEQNIKNINKNIEDGNANIRDFTERLIQRQKKIIQESNRQFEVMINSIPLELKIKDKRQPYVKLDIKEKMQPILKPDARKKDVLVLQDETLIPILEIIKNMGLQFELTPHVYLKLGEEDLRDIILATLNGIFDGDAVAEAFSKRGKTDIRLKLSRGEYLIIECGFWTGEKWYNEKLDQLFGYLTWEEDYGVLITFSKEKGFTNIINKACDSTNSRVDFIKNVNRVEARHFITEHKHPEDEKKSIKIHHILFHLSTK